MARPIPEIDLRHVSKTEVDKPIYDLSIDGIGKKSGKNLVLGTASGWCVGVCVIRIGKIAAFGLGGGIILLHFATECGYINVNWDRIRQTADESHAWVKNLVNFVKNNSCFSVGFIGGFFFGMAST